MDQPTLIPAVRLQGRRAALFVFAAALSVRLLYLAFIGRSPYFDVRQMAGTDNFAFYEWAGRIASGELIGTGEYYLPPLYPYLLALALKLSGPHFLLVPRLLQALMGAATAALVALLAARLFRPRAGLLAGLLVAFYGPLIFYEAQFLRTGLLAFLYTALVYVMVRGQERPDGRMGFAAGGLWAVGLIAKPTIAALLPAVPVWLWLIHKQARGRDDGGRSFRRFVALGALGFALFLAPLVARNVAADSPLFSVSRRGALEFAAGNLPGSDGEGWVLTPEALDLTLASDRRLSVTVVRVLAAWRDQPLGFVGLQLRKAGQFLSGFEIPNNVNYYVEREYVGLFRLPLVGWPAALALGLLGMVRLRRQWRTAFVIYAYVGLYSLGVVAFYVLARFRLPVAPALCVFGGIGLDALIELARAKDWKRLGAAAAFAALVVIAAWPRPDDPFRPGDYYNLARYHALRREPAQAFAWIERGRKSLEARAADHDPDALHHQRAWYMFVAGEPLDSVAAELRPALNSPSSVTAMQAGQLQRELDRRRTQDPKVLGLRFMSP